MKRLTAPLAVIALALAPALASADDASLYATQHQHARDFKAADRAYARAMKRAGHLNFMSRPVNRRVIAADRRIDALLGRLRTEVAAQQSSSDAGARAKACSLKAAGWWQRANRLEIRSMQLANRRRWRRAHIVYVASVKALRRAGHFVACQYRAFKAAGITHPAPLGQ